MDAIEKRMASCLFNHCYFLRVNLWRKLSEEEKRMQTEKLFNCSPNRYSVDRVSTFLGVQLGSEDEMNIKEKTIQTKEEVLMYAAAMLYANNSEFPYDIQLSEETVKTEIADITDITVIKK